MFHHTPVSFSPALSAAELLHLADMMGLKCKALSHTDVLQPMTKHPANPSLAVGVPRRENSINPPPRLFLADGGGGHLASSFRRNTLRDRGRPSHVTLV